MVECGKGSRWAWAKVGATTQALVTTRTSLDVATDALNKQNAAVTALGASYAASKAEAAEAQAKVAATSGAADRAIAALSKVPTVMVKGCEVPKEVRDALAVLH